LALLAACSASKQGAVPDGEVDTATTMQPLDADWTIDVGGVKRVAHVHVPKPRHAGRDRSS
jgi:hypothetical protein